MKNIKVICFDGDGVVLRKRGEFFSSRLSAKLNIPLERILPFFKGEYKQVMLGQANLKESLERYIGDWGWEGSVNDLIDFWFSGENILDEEVLDLIKSLRSKGYICCIASDHSRERAENLLTDFGLDKYFNNDFFSGKLGVTKEDPEFFEIICKTLGVAPNEIIFIDDDPKNVEVANNSGINGICFSNISDLLVKLNELGIKVEDGEIKNMLK